MRTPSSTLTNPLAHFDPKGRGDLDFTKYLQNIRFSRLFYLKISKRYVILKMPNKNYKDKL